MIDYSSFTGTITQLPTGVTSTKDVGTPDLVTSKAAIAFLKITKGRWEYWRKVNKLPEPYRVIGKKHLYRLTDIEKLL